jgi:hypothetical protein
LLDNTLDALFEGNMYLDLVDDRMNLGGYVPISLVFPCSMSFSIAVKAEERNIPTTRGKNIWIYNATMIPR